MLRHSDALCFAICLFFIDFKRVLRMEIKGLRGLKRDKIPQPRLVKSNGFQPGLYNGL